MVVLEEEAKEASRKTGGPQPASCASAAPGRGSRFVSRAKRVTSARTEAFKQDPSPAAPLVKAARCCTATFFAYPCKSRVFDAHCQPERPKTFSTTQHT